METLFIALHRIDYNGVIQPWLVNVMAISHVATENGNAYITLVGEKDVYKVFETYERVAQLLKVRQ